MKTVLIISPYFPPSNAADMQRVRMSLPYFKEFGWEAEVVCVSQLYSDINKDPLLTQSVPSEVRIHEVNALSKHLTAKLGLGSIAIRSLWYFKQKVNELIKKKKFDLIYFSTTQFPVCILGAYWKRKFGIPYVIDIQDPWHSEYYQKKPQNERPPKYWFSYRLNKYLEPIAMKKADGVISVSKAYLDQLELRYENIKRVPREVITFGAFEKDFEVVRANNNIIAEAVKFSKHTSNLLYIGRGGYDMHKALILIFKALAKGLEEENSLFTRIRLFFIGTSYAASGKGKKTIEPLARQMGVSDLIVEQTDRIPFFSGLNLLAKADALLIPGSDDPAYTASKVYPYMLTGKPILALFHQSSSVVDIMQACYNTTVATFDQQENEIVDFFYAKLRKLAEGTLEIPVMSDENFDRYTAKFMTKRQCELFESVLKITKHSTGSN